jgi:hypothetical protein
MSITLKAEGFVNQIAESAFRIAGGLRNAAHSNFRAFFCFHVAEVNLRLSRSGSGVST